MGFTESMGTRPLFAFVVWIAFLLAGLSVPAGCQPTGLPESILREAQQTVLLSGKYTESQIWDVGKFGHLVGRAVADPEALNGRAWEAHPGTDGAGYMLYGPYAELEAGDYIAFFRIKLLEEAPGEVLGSVDACVDAGKTILMSREVSCDELVRGRYAQVPLAFHHPGGRLECRLYWSGNMAARVSVVSLFRVEGASIASGVLMVPQPAPSGEPRNLVYRGDTNLSSDIFPRSAPPSPVLTVLDTRKCSPDWKLLLSTLQGIVNRAEPRIYYLTTASDSTWLDWMLKRKWISRTETVSSPEDLLAKFHNQVKGMIITDPALPASNNIATMLASLEDGIVASPRLAKGIALPVIRDLRGRWTKNVDAYRWAYQNLWSQMSHCVAACLWPEESAVRDYLVQHKVFIFWLPGRIDGARKYVDPEAEMRFGEELLAALPANTPIMGYPYAGADVGLGEGDGVALMAEFAKYLVGSVNCGNLSVHSGVRVPAFRQRRYNPPALRNDKVYLAFNISDGDNIPVITSGNWPQLWDSKARGAFPVGWTISPSSCVLIPDVMDYYYSTATPNDSFVAAVSGVGYTYPNRYAKRYRETDRPRVLDGFLDQTQLYMNRMDLRTINPSGAGDREIARFAERIPFLQAVFADYGKSVYTYPEAMRVTARNTPVFHAVTGWQPDGTRDQQIAFMVSQIRSITPEERPAFLHVFVCNWFYDLPALEEVLARLGPAYVAASPEQLAALCRLDMTRKQVLVGFPTSMANIEGCAASFRVLLRNVSSKPMDVRVKLAAGLRAPSVKPNRVHLLPGQEAAVGLMGMVSGRAILLDVEGPFGGKRFSSAMHEVPSTELAGSLPKALSLQFVRQYDAVCLAHTTGKAERDMESQRDVWVTVKGESRIGHMVYGPYSPLKAGRYLALFRLKRTGDGEGTVCVLDTCVGGGERSSAVREVGAGELPLGKYRAFPLIFNHPGGAVETRVFWTGKAALAVESVMLWEVASAGS
ncbi:MAG TPA: GxGYxYP domain-containing protein [Armatimonadota bacterium]|nr:GxGYxYP domain-containing protein [Armatimonadota bacterium]